MGLIDEIIDTALDFGRFLCVLAIPVLLIVILFGGAILGLAYLTRETSERTRAIYDAWCRMNNRQDVSLGDWKTMRANYMLPGMEAKRAAEAEAAAAVAIGVSAGAAAAR